MFFEIKKHGTVLFLPILSSQSWFAWIQATARRRTAENICSMPGPRSCLNSNQHEKMLNLLNVYYMLGEPRKSAPLVKVNSA